MATTSKETGRRGGERKGRASNGDVGSPVSNEAYNVITALQAKLEGLEAYRKYAMDEGDSEIWAELTRIETQGVTLLIEELERLVDDGELRAEVIGDH